MEWFNAKRPQSPVKVAILDFDGTLSTLRQGWEAVMRPFMLETLAPSGEEMCHLQEMVRQYVDESTGIQTIFQMKWLAAQAAQRGLKAADPWEYKAEYNRRLMETVRLRREALLCGQQKPEDYLIEGSCEFLQLLCEHGAAIHIASGTDEADVREEAEALGLSGLITGIAGAQEKKEACSKEAVIRMLLDEKGFEPQEVAVVGDGKVEIQIGHERGARTLGVASNEVLRHGVNPTKMQRLTDAGADAVVGDYSRLDLIRPFFFYSGL